MSDFAAAIFKHLREQAGAVARQAPTVERPKEHAALPPDVAQATPPKPAGSTDRHKRLDADEPKKVEVSQRKPSETPAREDVSQPSGVPFWVWVAVVGVVVAGVVGFGTWFVLRNG
jgi:hypothetical protein